MVSVRSLQIKAAVAVPRLRNKGERSRRGAKSLSELTFLFARLFLFSMKKKKPIIVLKSNQSVELLHGVVEIPKGREEGNE